MTRGIKRHRRRGSFVVLLVAFAALGVWASYALAGNDTGPVTVNVEYHNDDCGSTQGKRVIGTDIMNRSGDTLSVVHKVHGADPGTYDLYLYDAEGCSNIAYLGQYKVNGGGDGSKSNTADVSGTSGRFFVCDQNQSTPYRYDCSLTGKLGKSQFPMTSTI